jgi:hypothetical protein
MGSMGRMAAWAGMDSVTLLRLRGCTRKRRVRQKGRGWSTSALARQARGADDWRETEAVSGPGHLLGG